MSLDELMSQSYLLLALMNMTGILAYCLHKVGYGRVEDMPGFGWSLLAVALGPLMLFGWISLIVSIWALFALSFWLVLLVLVLTHLVWSAACWYALGRASAFGYEYALHKISIPLVILLRITCAGTAIFLGVSFWKGNVS